MSKATRTRAAARAGDVPQELLERGRQMAGMGRDVWLAGLGALAVVGEEGTHLFERLVESGEEVETRGKRELGNRRKELARALEDGQKEISTALDEQVVDPVFSALRRFGVAGRDEIDDISARVERLTRKVDRMLAHLTGEPVSPETPPLKVYRVVAAGSGGWSVGAGKDGAPTLHATKDEALEAARARARKDAPSRLEVFKRDGALQDVQTF